mmetsp:Transcript_6870/g.11012  ORF Transcript_6870/g.11012 Transcript_6870/m.11012 type:complete len:312 (-) Transcript_6870:2071-3006(-)
MTLPDGDNGPLSEALRGTRAKLQLGEAGRSFPVLFSERGRLAFGASPRVFLDADCNASSQTVSDLPLGCAAEPLPTLAAAAQFSCSSVALATLASAACSSLSCCFVTFTLCCSTTGAGLTGGSCLLTAAIGVPAASSPAGCSTVRIAAATCRAGAALTAAGSCAPAGCSATWAVAAGCKSELALTAGCDCADLIPRFHVNCVGICAASAMVIGRAAESSGPVLAAAACAVDGVCPAAPAAPRGALNCLRAEAGSRLISVSCGGAPPSAIAISRALVCAAAGLGTLNGARAWGPRSGISSPSSGAGCGGPRS